MAFDNFSLTILEESKPEARCPHIRADQESPYCGKDLDPNSDNISQERRMVCDFASLQKFCTSDYEICIWYNGVERFRE